MKTFRIVSLFPALLLLTLLLAPTSGCTSRTAADSHEGHDHAAQAANPDSVQAAAAPGGLMCGEHGVLESMCTECHPELASAFQAKGDWCAEHQFPESVCPRCHPERGGRPVDESLIPDGAPADRSQLRFRTLQTAREAGIQVVAATEGADPAGVTATASIVVDAAHRALVHAPAAGIVREVLADVGAHVAQGAPLARITSAPVAESRAQMRAARARFEASRAAFVRESTLFANQLGTAQAVLAARQELESARGDMASAGASLDVVGTTEAGAGSYVVRSPLAGTVTERTAVLGTMVATDTPLFEVMDPHALWADIDVPESQAAAVRTGQEVTLQVRGRESHDARAVVHSVAPALDAQSRTLRVRARLDADGARGLRANTYARAIIRTGSPARTVLVPRDAVQEARGVKLVFVRLAEDRYEVRRVRVGEGEGSLLAVHDGLSGGELVVTTGSFLLKTETIKESIGAGCCDVEAPKGR